MSLRDGVAAEFQRLNRQIKELENWKREAIEVIEQWDEVYDLVKTGATDLGKTKSSIVAKHIQNLESLLRELTENEDIEIYAGAIESTMPSSPDLEDWSKRVKLLLDK